MRNIYLRELNKIEFALTYACMGRCKHCSVGENRGFGERLEPDAAAHIVREVAGEYDIETVMVFGGEPLVHPDAVYAVISCGRDLHIPHRQLITSGYFTRESERIGEVCERLSECGVNDLLLSVDAFHQEYIPLEAVRGFAEEAIGCGIPTRLQPAWLVGREADNPYNRKTRRILDTLAYLGAPEGNGNIVFPEGNALRFLAEYFVDNKPHNPYIEDPCRVKCLSVAPDGSTLDGNIYERDIMDIIRDYNPTAR